MKMISRRSFLTAAGLSAAALILTACGASSSAAASVSSASASGQTIFRLEDLAGKIVGVQLGTTGDLYMSEEIGGGLNIASVERFDKIPDAVQALLTEKIDAVCIDGPGANEFVAANSGRLTLLDTAYAVENYAICINKKNTALTEAFNSAIAARRADGTLDAIMDKYINKTEGAAGYVTPAGTAYPNGRLIMVTNAILAPYEYIENGSIIGIDAEFARAICDTLGYELQIEDIEFASIIPAVQSGKADFGMATITITDERMKNIDFTDSYCSGVQSIIVRK